MRVTTVSNGDQTDLTYGVIVLHIGLHMALESSAWLRELQLVEAGDGEGGHVVGME